MFRVPIAALVAGLSASALAQTVPSGQMAQRPPSWTSPQSSSALPGAGDVQLFLEPPPFMNAISPHGGAVDRGLGVSSRVNGETTLALGINGGVGYFLTDVFEAGAAVAFDYGETGLDLGLGTHEFLFGVEPFVKANLGRVISEKTHVNPFADLGLILAGVVGDASTGIFGADLNLGVEFFLSHGWGVSVYIPFVMEAATAGAVDLGFGLGYGLVTYF